MLSTSRLGLLFSKPEVSNTEEVYTLVHIQQHGELHWGCLSSTTITAVAGQECRSPNSHGHDVCAALLLALEDTCLASMGRMQASVPKKDGVLHHCRCYIHSKLCPQFLLESKKNASFNHALPEYQFKPDIGLAAQAARHTFRSCQPTLPVSQIQQCQMRTRQLPPSALGHW